MMSDYVQYELKTHDNMLSLWKISTEEDLNDAFVALVTSGESIGTVQVVKIDENLLDTFSFNQDEGDSPTFEINHKHCNVTNLTYEKIGKFIDVVLYTLKSNGCVRKTKSQMKQLIKEAERNHKLNPDRMNSQMIDAIKRI